MKGFRKAALPIISVLIAAIISLTSVTFAWFTSGNFATVEQINVDVESTGGLQIALAPADASDASWSNNVALDDSLQNKLLAPVSTSASAFDLVTDTPSGKVAGRLNFFTAAYDKAYDRISNIQKVTTNAKAYLEFDLYFLNTELKAKNIDLNETVVTSMTGNSHKAVRIAFVKHGKVTSTASVQGANFDLTTYEASNLTIYEPNAEEHTAAGATDSKNNGGAETGVLTYKGLNATCAADQYVNRFTGQIYQMTKGETRYTNDADRNPVDPVESSLFHNGTAFVAWTEAADYTKIATADQANSLFLAGTKVYDSNFALVTSADAFDSGDFYLYTPVDTFLPTAGSVMETVTTKTSAGATFFSLDAQSITKVTVYIWLEGQDVDCEDTIASHAFSVAFKFNATYVA